MIPGGLNTVMRFIDSGILILVFLFFTTVDPDFSKAGIFIKVFISIGYYRKYYRQFFQFAVAYVEGHTQTWQLSASKVWSSQPITAMVLTLQH